MTSVSMIKSEGKTAHDEKKLNHTSKELGQNEPAAAYLKEKKKGRFLGPRRDSHRTRRESDGSH